MIKVINVTDIQNGKQALLCLCFVYLLFHAPVCITERDYEELWGCQK